MSKLTKADLHAAMRARRVANLRYERIVFQARKEGWSNTEIARAMGLTEAAIRLYQTRHQPSTYSEDEATA